MGTKIFKGIFLVLGAVFLLYGIIVLLVIGPGHWFNFIFAMAGIVFLAIGFFLKKILRLPKGVLAAVLLAAALLLTDLTVFEVKIAEFGQSKPAAEADYVIILGARVNKSNPSLEFARRIDAGASYAEDNPSCMIVTTGGRGEDEPVSEGMAAKTRLVAKGIAEDRILVEEQSTSTLENFQYASDLIVEDIIRKNDAADDEALKTAQESSVVVISSSFHLYRASKILETLGYSNVSYLGVRGKAILMPQYYLREYCAFLLESVRGHF